MTPIIHIKPGVQLAGIRPEMAVVLDVVPIVFARNGYDCWVTSAVRPNDPGKHGSGEGLDFDSSTDVPEETGHRIAASAKSFLGDDFDIIWHRAAGGRWHLHAEYDRKVA